VEPERDENSRNQPDRNYVEDVHGNLLFSLILVELTASVLSQPDFDGGKFAFQTPLGLRVRIAGEQRLYAVAVRLGPQFLPA
jgi:hypothetical protein